MHYTSVSRTILPSLHVSTYPFVSIARCLASTAARRIAASTPLKKASFCFFVGAPALGAPFVLIILFTISPFRNHISIDEGAIPAV